MKNIEEMIDEAVMEISPNGTEQERKECAARLIDSIAEGRTLSPEELGLTANMLNDLYAFSYRLYNTGKYEDGSLLFALLSLIDSNNPDYVFALGACYHRLKRYTQAMNSYMAAFFLNTNNPLPFFHIADCYIQMQKPAHAIFSLGMVIAQADNNPKYAVIKHKAQMMRDRLLHDVEQGIT